MACTGDSEPFHSILESPFSTSRESSGIAHMYKEGSHRSSCASDSILRELELARVQLSTSRCLMDNDTVLAYRRMAFLHFFQKRANNCILEALRTGHNTCDAYMRYVKDVGRTDFSGEIGLIVDCIERHILVSHASELLDPMALLLNTAMGDISQSVFDVSTLQIPNARRFQANTMVSNWFYVFLRSIMCNKDFCETVGLAITDVICNQTSTAILSELSLDRPTCMSPTSTTTDAAYRARCKLFTVESPTTSISGYINRICSFLDVTITQFAWCLALLDNIQMSPSTIEFSTRTIYYLLACSVLITQKFVNDRAYTMEYYKQVFDVESKRILRKMECEFLCLLGFNAFVPAEVVHAYESYIVMVFLWTKQPAIQFFKLTSYCDSAVYDNSLVSPKPSSLAPISSLTQVSPLYAFSSLPSLPMQVESSENLFPTLVVKMNLQSE